MTPSPASVLCLRDWLSRDVLRVPRYRTTDADLEAYFADRDVQAYVRKRILATGCLGANRASWSRRERCGLASSRRVRQRRKLNVSSTCWPFARLSCLPALPAVPRVGAALAMAALARLATLPSRWSGSPFAPLIRAQRSLSPSQGGSSAVKPDPPNPSGKPDPKQPNACPGGGCARPAAQGPGPQRTPRFRAAGGLAQDKAEVLDADPGARRRSWHAGPGRLPPG